MVAMVGSALATPVAEAADAFLAEIAIDRLDPDGSITPASRRLCAGLGILSQATHRALGGKAEEDAVGLAGAMLSLLTKLDDQVIDGRSFHEGLTREAARARTRAYLAPTLASIRTGTPALDDERCRFAARLGGRLARLGPCEHLLASIARGWEVQERAVATLTRHAREVTLAEVETVTREISGVWLLMIAEIGTLGARPFTSGERDAFLLWGDAIQKADALNDLTKDVADGHWSTFPLRLLYERAPDAYEAARRGERPHPLLARYGVSEACQPGIGLADARLAHASLGEVPALLDWIHAHLLARWTAQASTSMPGSTG